jgi:hypothetical protein
MKKLIIGSFLLLANMAQSNDQNVRPNAMTCVEKNAEQNIIAIKGLNSEEMCFQALEAGNQPDPEYWECTSINERNIRMEQGQIVFDFNDGDQIDFFSFSIQSLAQLVSGEKKVISGEYTEGYWWADGDHINAPIKLDCQLSSLI